MLKWSERPACRGRRVDSLCCVSRLSPDWGRVVFVVKTNPMRREVESKGLYTKTKLRLDLDIAAQNLPILGALCTSSKIRGPRLRLWEVKLLPSEKILQKKQEQVEALTGELKNALAGVIVDYKGINVADDTKLRKELREAGVSYRVIKNSLLRRASENVGYDALKDVLVETTALALSDTDYTAAAKILCKYADASKGKFTIKAGFVEGTVLDVKGVVNLSKLPSREELVAMTLRGLNAPISGLANVLNANIRGLAIVLGQIAEKGEKTA